jgi:hypothetical protein
MNREITGVALRAGAHDILITDQDDGWPAGAGALHGRLDRDFGADAVGIANGECDGGNTHSGNAISVSMRELSHTTIRSFSRTLPSSIL